MDAIAGVLVALSRLVCDFDEIVELDINPLLADAGRCRRTRCAHACGGEHRCACAARLCIRPYPAELEHSVTLARLGDILVRPIRPDDADALSAFFSRLDPEDVRHRFFVPLRNLGPRQLARLTQIDYDREMALCAWAPSGDMLAVARLVADPDGERAEFAVTVRSDVKRHGLGRLLVGDLIAYARRRGIAEIFGEILADNVAMLALCDGLRFARDDRPGAIVHVTCSLT